MNNFFEELKRRNVYKVATAYVVTSWLIIQVVNTIGPNLGFPDTIPALITRILIVGFPIALILAWLYELTPQGFKRTGEVQEDTPDNRNVGKKLNRIIIISLTLVVALMLVERLFFRGPLLNNDQQTASIAVLPFVNMSSNAENEYFADGLAEQILDELARLSGLKVTARTSSFAFKGKNTDMRTIGKELNVNYLLEGSVRYDEKSNKIKITAQLINAANGYHLWSKNYDEDFDAIFEIQEDVGRSVASELKVRLLPQEDELLATKMTENTEAYKLFIQARQHSVKRGNEELDKAIELLKKSLELDPNFAEAHAELSFLYGQKHFYGNLSLNERDKLMDYHVEKALELGPDKPEVLRAKARNDSRLGRDTSMIISDLRRAIELKPNYSDAHYLLHQQLASIEGKLALKALEKTVEIDPLGFFVAMLAQRYFYEYDEQEKAMDMVDQLIRNDTVNGPYAMKSRFMVSAPNGDNVKAFKYLHKRLKNDPYNRLFIGHLLLYALNLDLAPWSEKYMDLYQSLLPDNPQTLRRILDINDFQNKYNESIYIINYWADNKGMGDKELELAYQYYYLKDYTMAEKLLREGYPELINKLERTNPNTTLPIDDSNEELIAFYILIQRHLDRNDRADFLAKELCQFYSLKERSYYSSWVSQNNRLTCLDVRNDPAGLAEKLDSLFFIDRNRILVGYSAFKSGYYDDYQSSPEMQDIRRRITEETHRMRVEVIQYLKEEGDWDPAWDKELGLN